MGAGSGASLALDSQGIFGSVFGRMTKDITERYLAFEARFEDALRKSAYRHQETAG